MYWVHAGGCYYYIIIEWVPVSRVVGALSRSHGQEWCCFVGQRLQQNQLVPEVATPQLPMSLLLSLL